MGVAGLPPPPDLLLLCCPSSNFERQTWLFSLLLKTPQWLILMPSFTSVHLTPCASSYPALLAVTCAISQICTFFLLFFSGLTCHSILLLIRNNHSPSGLSSRNFLSFVKLPVRLPTSCFPSSNVFLHFVLLWISLITCTILDCKITWCVSVLLFDYKLTKGLIILSLPK